MLILAIALAAAGPDTQLTVQQQEDVIVLGRKLKAWKGTARFRKGRYECTTKRASGDPAVDRLACSAMVQCMAEAQPKVDKLLANRPAKKERNRLLQPVHAEMEGCLKAAHEEGLRQLATQEEASLAQ